MGILERLEDAVRGTGVAVAIEMPGTDPSGQIQQVRVILTARREPRVVTGIELRVVHRETLENAPTIVGARDVEGEWSESRTLMSLSNTDRVEVQPGHPVAVPFEVQLGIMGGDADETVGPFSGGREVSGGYYLQARVTVEGSHLHPHATETFQEDPTPDSWRY